MGNMAGKLSEAIVDTLAYICFVVCLHENWRWSEEIADKLQPRHC